MTVDWTRYTMEEVSVAVLLLLLLLLLLVVVVVVLLLLLVLLLPPFRSRERGRGVSSSLGTYSPPSPSSPAAQSLSIRKKFRARTIGSVTAVEMREKELLLCKQSPDDAQNTEEQTRSDDLMGNSSRSLHAGGPNTANRHVPTRVAR